MDRMPPTTCPRCHGVLFTARDWAGQYSSCLICGYVYEWGDPPPSLLPEDGPGAPRQRQPSHGTVRL